MLDEYPVVARIHGVVGAAFALVSPDDYGQETVANFVCWLRDVVLLLSFPARQSGLVGSEPKPPEAAGATEGGTVPLKD